MSERLCKWCNELIAADSLRTVSVLSYGYTLVLDEIANRTHLLLSEKRTQLALRRKQPKTEIASVEVTQHTAPRA